MRLWQIQGLGKNLRHNREGGLFGEEEDSEDSGVQFTPQSSQKQRKASSWGARWHREGEVQVPAPSGRGDHGSDEGDIKAAANMRGLAKDPSYNFAMTSSNAALGFVWPVLFKQLVCTRAGHFRLP